MDNPLYVAVTSVAKYAMTVDMFPVFFFVHFAIGNIIVREDSKHLGSNFPKKHPFTSWFCALITSLSGAFIADFMFGNSLLNTLKENYLIGYLTFVWYLMNFSPFDVVYKLATHPLVITPMSILQEHLRLRFVYLGLMAAARDYPNAPMIIMVGGIIKGNGYGFIKMFERLVRGHWKPETNEFLDVSYFNKSGVIASLLFLLHHYKLITIPIELLYLGILFAFIVGRLTLMLGGVKDPLAPLQAPFCRVLFGSWEDEKPQKDDKRDREDNKSNNNKKNKNNNSGSGGKKNSNKKTD